MASRDPTCPPRRTADVRLSGFASRASVREALAWALARAAARPAERLAIGDAAGRTLAAEVRAAADVPAHDTAREDGFAVRAADTVGAGGYNPLLLAIADGGGPLAPGSAALLEAGAPLPAGADAVLPFAAAQLDGGALEVVAAVAEGAGVARPGAEARAGEALLAAGRLLAPHDLALLASARVGHVEVVRRPRVRLVVAGAKRASPSSEDPPDADGPMLRALVARDGGDVERLVTAAAREAVAAALAAPGADLVLVAGRTGTGRDDEAPLALADAGEVAFHGVAMRPGGSAGGGVAGGAPVLLLPGEPLACLAAYEVLAAPLLRGLAGLARPAHATREVEVGRKIVSGVGSLDLVQVRIVDGRAEPVGSAEEGGIASAVRATGFVRVEDPLEGHAPGSRVTVHLYGSPDDA